MRKGTHEATVPRVAIILLVLGIISHIFFARPVGLRGLLLDESLMIIEGSIISNDAPIRVGDNVVSINNTTVANQETFVLSVLAGEKEVDARIRQNSRSTTLLLTPERLNDDLPSELAGDYFVKQIDGVVVERFVGLDELAHLAGEVAPEPLVVELEASGLVDGTTPVEHSLPPWGGLMILGFGFIAGLSFFLLRHDYQKSRGSAFWIDAAALILGTLGVAGMLSFVANSMISPRFFIWSLALIALWRSISSLLHSSTIGVADIFDVQGWLLFAPGALAALAGLGLLFSGMGEVSVSWIVAYHNYLLSTLLLVTLYHVFETIIYFKNFRRLPLGSWIGIVGGLVISTLAVALIALKPEYLNQNTFAYTLAGSVSLLWIGDFVGLFPNRNVAKQAENNSLSSGGSLMNYLQRLNRSIGEGEVAIIAGIDEQFTRIFIGDPTADGNKVLISQKTPQAVGGMLTMLAMEGGMYPRHEVQDGVHNAKEDPFHISAQRLGVSAAFPVHAKTAGINAFVVVTDAPEETNLQHLARAIGDGLMKTASSEVTSIVATELLKEINKKQAQNLLQHSQEIKAEELMEIELDPITPDAIAWAAFLARGEARVHPVDDPASLNENEWRALLPLAETNSPILLVGEPGVGKAFLARAIHSKSDRSEERIGELDCATTPLYVIHYELFGSDEEPGLVELLHDGTLVLKGASGIGHHELETLIARLQNLGIMLIFTERYTGPEGGIPNTIPATIRRVVEDRYLHVTPLRDRSVDVRRYARFFLHQAAMRYGRVITDFADLALNWLAQQPLPGNFTELNALVRRAVLHSKKDAITIQLSNVSTSELPQQDPPPVVNSIFDELPDPLSEQLGFPIMSPDEDVEEEPEKIVDDSPTLAGLPVLTHQTLSTIVPSFESESTTSKLFLEDIFAPSELTIPSIPSSLKTSLSSTISPPSMPSLETSSLPALLDPITSQMPIFEETELSERKPPKKRKAPKKPLSAGENSERQTILAMLNQCGGNKSATARELGMSRGKLLRLMTKLGLH